MNVDVAVIGAGPAGLATALAAAKHNCSVLLLERHQHLGGILPQCIHSGFGNFILKQNLTGPEYAYHFIQQVKTQTNIDIKTNTMVLQIKDNNSLIAINPTDGIFTVQPKAVILAMGCREKTRNQILIPGTRPAGIYTAGTAQQLMNIFGVIPGKNIVILGSGDIGLIMARRFTLEGAKVHGVFEIQPTPNGLIRNIVQCLEDFNIPLQLSSTIIEIHGKHRITHVTTVKVDDDKQPIIGSEQKIACDCLILAVGLIPENELSQQINLKIDPKTSGPIVDEHMHTSKQGVFACGNVVHVYDIVDDVTLSANIAGTSAAQYVQNKLPTTSHTKIEAGKNVKYVIPQFISGNEETDYPVYLRSTKTLRNVVLTLEDSQHKTSFYKKIKYARPAELLKISLSPQKIQETKSKQLTLHLR